MNPRLIFLVTSVLYLAVFLIASAAIIKPGTVPSAGQLGIEESPVQSTSGLVGVLRGIVQTTYVVFFIIATLLILFAAYNYLTAQGNEEKISSAHRQLLYAGIAIAVALLAVGASTIIRNFLESPTAGGGGDNSYPTLTPGSPYYPAEYGNQ